MLVNTQKTETRAPKRSEPSNLASMARFAPFACSAMASRYGFAHFKGNRMRLQTLAVGPQRARCGYADLHRRKLSIAFEEQVSIFEVRVMKFVINQT
jgi:hypothetical protein